MTATSVGTATVTITPDIDQVTIVLGILTSMLDGLANELRVALEDLNRLTDPGPTDGTAYVGSSLEAAS